MLSHYLMSRVQIPTSYLLWMVLHCCPVLVVRVSLAVAPDCCPYLNSSSYLLSSRSPYFLLSRLLVVDGVTCCRVQLVVPTCCPYVLSLRVVPTCCPYLLCIVPILSYETAFTILRFIYLPLLLTRGCSSNGRAPALHAGDRDRYPASPLFFYVIDWFYSVIG